MLLGDISGLSARSVTWTTSWATEGVKTFSAVASADNIDGGSEVQQETITVGGTPQTGPSGLTSTTHVAGVPSCESLLGLGWNAAVDPLSGLAGYRLEIDSSPSTVPTSTTLNVGAGQTSASVALSPGSWYAHLRARDRSGNWGTTRHAGPFLYAPGTASTYCIGAPNSTGVGASIGYSGSSSISDNDFVLLCGGLPANRPCLFFYGPSQAQVPFGNGFRCVGGSIVRLPAISTGSGAISFALDFTSLPPSGEILPGTTRRFQNWYRDPAAGGANFNLSNALSATFCE